MICDALRLKGLTFRPALAALDEHPAALPPKLAAALKQVDTQMDTLN